MSDEWALNETLKLLRELNTFPSKSNYGIILFGFFFHKKNQMNLNTSFTNNSTFSNFAVINIYLIFS